MKRKHAYLIIAHNNFDILEKLIKLLDNCKNDIYIHIDKKVNNFDFDFYKKLVRKSNIFFTSRISVNWGGFSQVKCELILLKAAIKHGYDYYHLLSGVDLPLKTQDEIHHFFDQNEGINFVHFASDDIGGVTDRIAKYHLFQEYKRSVNKIFKIILFCCDFLFKFTQKVFNIDRLKKSDFVLKYGSNWFSITDELARAIVDNENWIKKYFSYSKCADELFLQTFIFNSKFKSYLPNSYTSGDYINCMRKIDWNRGKPYTWRINDFDELLNSSYMFARKFDYDVDKAIVEKIYNSIYSKQINKYSI